MRFLLTRDGGDATPSQICELLQATQRVRARLRDAAPGESLDAAAMLTGVANS
jgi:hypothetical protein